MFDKIALYFWPNRPFERDPETVAAIQIFLRTCGIVMVLRTSFMLLYLYRGWPHLAFIIFVQLLALIGGLYIFKFHGKLSIAGHVPALGFIYNCASTMWQTGGLASPIIVIIPLVIFYVVVVFGMRIGTIYTFLFSVLLIIFYFLEEKYLLPVSTLTSLETIFYRAVNYIFCVVLFLWMYAAYSKIFMSLKELLREQRSESSHLLQVISHDLRSPLQILHSYTQLIPETSSKEKINEYAGSMQKSLDRITNVLDQVRSYESFMGGKKLVELEEVDLIETLEYLLEVLDSQIKSKNLKVKINAPKERLLVRADQVALSEHILANFLTNAFKFTPENGEVNLNIRKSRSNVRLDIVDSGIGMDSEMIKSIFNFSKSTTRPGTFGEKGTGFGMPIAKIFLDQMKIDVFITSRDRQTYPQDHGTTVSLNFRSVN